MSERQSMLRVNLLVLRKDALEKAKFIAGNVDYLKLLGYSVRGSRSVKVDETHVNVQRGTNRSLIRISEYTSRRCLVQLCLSSDEFENIEKLTGYSKIDIARHIEKVLPTSYWTLATNRAACRMKEKSDKLEIICNQHHIYREELEAMLNKATERRTINPMGLGDSRARRLHITLPMFKSDKFGAAVLGLNSKIKSMGYVATRDPDTQEVILSTIRDPNEVMLRITNSKYQPNIELCILTMTPSQANYLTELTGINSYAINHAASLIIARGTASWGPDKKLTIQDDICSDTKFIVEYGHPMYDSTVRVILHYKGMLPDVDLTSADLATLAVDDRLTLSGSISGILGNLVMDHAPDRVWSELVPVDQTHAIRRRSQESGVTIENKTTNDYIGITRVGVDYNFKISLNIHDFDNQLSYLGIPIKLIRMVITSSTLAMLDSKRDLARVFASVPRADATDQSPSSEARKLMNVGSAGFTPNAQSAEAGQTRNLLTVKRAEVLAEGFAIQDKIRELQRELEVKNVDLNAIESAIKSLDTIKHLL